MIEKRIDEYLKEATGTAQRKKHCLDQVYDAMDSVERVIDWLSGFYDTDLRDKFKHGDIVHDLREIMGELQGIHNSISKNIK